MSIICELVLLKTRNLEQRCLAHIKHIVIILGTFFLFIAGSSYHAVAQNVSGVPSIPKQKSYSLSKDGTAVDFTVTGRMPAHARMHVTSVEREDEEGNPMLAAYDITLTDGQNQEWQPAYGQPAQVTITDPNFGNGKELDIFHETEEGREYVATVVSVNNTVTFPAKHFSVYVIGTKNGKNRMVISFVRPVGHTSASPDSLLYDTVSMVVKRADTIYNGKFMTRLVYPPGIKYIPEGANFFGWSRTPNYTASPESRMTIDVVRQIVYDTLKTMDTIEVDCRDTMMFYSVLLKSYNISYRSRKSNVIIGVDQVLYLLNDTIVQDYTVNEAYIPSDANANFEGWLLAEGDTNLVEGNTEYNIYPNGTHIKIKGNLTFMEELAYGYWLVFNENGKGASYIAPKFLRSNELGEQGDTLSLAKPEDPERYGYNFGGWYADSLLTEPFIFEGYLDHDAVIYARWVEKEKAFYTIIVWRQNVARNGYDFAEAFSNVGNVGYSVMDQAIDIDTLGHLIYVTVNGKRLGGIQSVANGTISDPYTGFTLSTENPIVDKEVTPDGQAVVNIYFDRMKYKLKLYVVRTDADGNSGYTGTKRGNSTLPEAPYFLGDWSDGEIITLSKIPELFGNTPNLYDSYGSYRYYYYPITAYYGENIRNLWPTLEDITVKGSNFVSWFLMSTAKAFVGGTSGTGNGTGGNTLKGGVFILDEQILGRLDDSTANLLMARYAPTYCTATFNIYFADVNGSYDESSPDTIIFTRAGQNNYTFLLDKAPSFDGYDADSSSGYNGSSHYELNYYYLRKSYSITFRDGVYRDGDNSMLQNKSSSMPLGLITNVIHGSDISGYNDYKPILPQGEEGFVFEGWYMDEACSKPYTFTTMPAGNLVVYAGWRQIQYRVFLHPQAGTDPSLFWGNTSQKMNFRKNYGVKVSAPTGQRDLYEFGGWYSDSTYQHRFFSEITTLNEQTVTTPYIKKDNPTDSMDRWGFIHNPVNGIAFNSDTIVVVNGDSISKNDRFWITKKLDLYAQWRHKLDGAEGVQVVYHCDECDSSSMPKTDTNLYLDKSKMVAKPAAASAVDNKIFAYWVLQNWSPVDGKFVDSLDANGNPVNVYPGGPYTLHLPYAYRKQVTEDSAVYIYQLRAELESFEDNHTFIVWYRNWKGAWNDTVRYDKPDSLTINMMKPIPSPDEVGEREGYIYKGWHRKGYGPEGSGQESTFEDKILGDTTTVNCLWYNPDDKQYYSKDYTTLDQDSFNFYRAAYGVAADEVTPYDYFYAVWEPIQYTIQFHKNTEDPIVTGTMEDQIFKYNETKELSKIGFLYKCHKFLGWATSENGDVVFFDQQEVSSLTSKKDSVIHLYAKWEEEDFHLVVSPDSATCLNPGSIDIQLNGVSMPNYTYSVIGLDTTVTPHAYTDTVWQETSSWTYIVAGQLVHGQYRVEVVTGSQCEIHKDTTVFLNPVEVTWDNPIETVCTGSPFVIKPSKNDDVRYLWETPTKRDGAVVFPDTANNNNPQEYILCTIDNSADSAVSYKIHAILGNCELGDVSMPIEVSSANHPPFSITLSSETDTLCAGTPVDVTATVNNNIYDSVSYTLRWKFNGTEYNTTVTDHSPTVTHTLTMPSDTCRGDFSVEVYYANVTECRVNAVKNFKVRIKDWDVAAPKNDTIHCVNDTVAPHNIPNLVPKRLDGCGNEMTPTLDNKLEELSDHACSGTVTYTYQYKDCDGHEKYWDYVYHIEKEAPAITITEVPAPEPVGACRYSIPEIRYTLDDCDPTQVTVAQTPSPDSRIQQPNGSDSVITITLTATDKCDNTTTKDITVTIPAHPTVTPMVEKNAFCLGDTIRVTAATTGTSNAAVITWTSTPSTGVFTYTEGEDTTFTATSHDPYTLTAVVKENECYASGETSVTVKAGAQLTVTNKNQTVCLGNEDGIANIYIMLQYTDSLNISGDLRDWMNIHKENTNIVISGKPDAIGTYELYLTTVSQNSDCGEAKDTVTIVVKELSDEDVTIDGDTVFCEGTARILSVDPDAKSYRWAKDDNTLYKNKYYLEVYETGTYTVTVTAQNGCISTGSKYVRMNPRPAVSIFLTEDTVCPNNNIQQISANITSPDKAPYTYSWTIADTIINPEENASFNGTWYNAEPTITLPTTCTNASYYVTLHLTDSSGCTKTVTDTIVKMDELRPLPESTNP